MKFTHEGKSNHCFALLECLAMVKSMMYGSTE